MSDQPHFRFYPNAYAEGGPFKRSDETCDVCERQTVWLYTGEIYLEDEPPSVCARCLASGALRQRLPSDSFVLQDVVLEGADEALTNEVLYATPNVASINPFEWPVLDGEPLAYSGIGDDVALKRNAAAQRAIAQAFADLGEENGHPSQALVFRRLDTEEFVAVIDMD
ncbi:MAG: CbrC family protein [Vitreimonas sp.]